MKKTKRISYAALILLVMAFTAAFRSDALAMLRETEPNNTFSQANEFQLNGAEFAGQLYSTSDVDVFKFYASGPGVLSFSINPENSNYDGGVIRVTIKNSSSTILASKDLDSDSTGIDLNTNVSTAGYYYLVIDQKPGYLIFDKDYQITPTIITDPAAISHREIEPNNSPGQANEFHLNGETFAGQLYSVSDVDIFKFNVTGPAVLSFSMKPENSNYDGGVVRTSIKDSALNVLASKDLDSDSISVNLSASVAPGQYYLVIDQKPGYQIFDKDYQITPTSTGNEIVSTPNAPSGTVNGIVTTGYNYSTGGSLSSLDHTIEYQFDWKGDGSNLSFWGPPVQSESWTVGGAYNVKARARCVTDTSVVSSWSSGLSVSIYAPGIYVGQDGLCGGNNLCFTSIQNGIDSAQSFTIVEITQETYNENVILDDPKVLILDGGWDSTFTTIQSNTTIHGSLTISGGKVIVENIILQ